MDPKGRIEAGTQGTDTMGEARRHYLKQLTGLPLYVAPSVVPVSPAEEEPLLPAPAQAPE